MKKELLEIYKENTIINIKIIIGDFEKEIKITEALLDQQVFPTKIDITDVVKDYADWKIKECLPEKVENPYLEKFDCDVCHGEDESCQSMRYSDNRAGFNTCIDQILTNKDKIK